jgi:hypothetical protein
MPFSHLLLFKEADLNIPSKLSHVIQLMKIQLEGRLAITPELKIAPILVTGCYEA